MCSAERHVLGVPWQIIDTNRFLYSDIFWQATKYFKFNKKKDTLQEAYDCFEYAFETLVDNDLHVKIFEQRPVARFMKDISDVALLKIATSKFCTCRKKFVVKSNPDMLHIALERGYSIGIICGHLKLGCKLDHLINGEDCLALADKIHPTPDLFKELVHREWLTRANVPL